MVYKIFDINIFAIKNEIRQNERLAEELHKPIIRKCKKIKVCSSFKDNTFGTRLTDMQLLSKFNKLGFYYVSLIFLVNMHGLFL